MVPYAWGMPGERELKPDDQVFYTLPDVEWDKKAKAWVRVGVMHRCPGIVQREKSGTQFLVFCLILNRNVMCDETDLEYVPPYDDQLPVTAPKL